jgi:hypothetical protein
MGRIRKDKRIEELLKPGLLRDAVRKAKEEFIECGSVSSSGRICNHKLGHNGKCARIEKDIKGRYFVIEYWEKENVNR